MTWYAEKLNKFDEHKFKVRHILKIFNNITFIILDPGASSDHI